MLRLTLGTTAVVQGIMYLSDDGPAPFSVRVAALSAAGCGLFLIVGLMTPIAALLAFFGSLGIALSIILPAAHHLLAAPLPIVYTSVTALAVALLGPGAFSLDALMFGRREIIIPAKSNQPKS